MLFQRKVLSYLHVFPQVEEPLQYMQTRLVRPSFNRQTRLVRWYPLKPLVLH